jgi:hypothetical protein
MALRIVIRYVQPSKYAIAVSNCNPLLPTFPSESYDSFVLRLMIGDRSPLSSVARKTAALLAGRLSLWESLTVRPFNNAQVTAYLYVTQSSPLNSI